MGHDVSQRYLAGRLSTPRLILDHAFLEAAVAHSNAVRDADQFEISKHHTGALAAIIEHHVNAGRCQLAQTVTQGRRVGVTRQDFAPRRRIQATRWPGICYAAREFASRYAARFIRRRSSA